MRQPESIEDMLSRLMPVAISEEGQRSMDAMLDELCGEEAGDAPAIAEIPQRKKAFWKFAVPPVGIAAATALAFFHPGDGLTGELTTISAPASTAPEMVLLGESDRIETLTDEGWLADPQGFVMQAAKARVVKENTIRDEATGIVFQISEARKELILTDPVTSF